MKKQVTYKVVNEKLFKKMVDDVHTEGLRGNGKEFNGDLVINFKRGRQILTHSVSGEMYYTDFVNRYGFELAVIE